MSRKPDPTFAFGEETPSMDILCEEIVGRRDLCKDSIEDIRYAMDDYEKGLKRNAVMNAPSLVRIAER